MVLLFLRDKRLKSLTYTCNNMADYYPIKNEWLVKTVSKNKNYKKSFFLNIDLFCKVYEIIYFIELHYLFLDFNFKHNKKLEFKSHLQND